MIPPVEPRPNRTEEGPLSTSTDSEVEGGAGVLAQVAHPVDVDIVAGREAAQGEVVALAPARLPRGQADAGHRPQRVAQGEHRALVEHLLRDDGDGLRRV